ncbi:hypothetical protein BH18ACT1_BH18ACT1_04870 [soil metagenome]
MAIAASSTTTTFLLCAVLALVLLAARAVTGQPDDAGLEALST